ncbi:MAG: caspase family protein, partial [Chloroflexaceae bacterium]|nr:caspase family protein [Chloroflexaceae bacterium]
MRDDLAATLRSLRDLHAMGLLDDAEYADKLERLRERFGYTIVDALLRVVVASPESRSGAPASTGGARAGTGLTPPVADTRADPLPHNLSADGVHFSYGHALIIGVSEYAHPHFRLPGGTTASDARALASLLRDPHLAAYPEQQVRLLVDSKATRNYVLDALEELAHLVEGGTALICFAGRGAPTAAGYALLPFDADPDRLVETALTAEVFHRRVAKVRERAQRLVVLLNCCQALGEDDPDVPAAALSGAAPPPEFYRPLSVSGDQVVISSARPGQRAGSRSAVNPRHTIFGEHLLLALGGQAPGAGPAVGVFDLYAYLRVAVPADGRSLQRHEALVQEPLFYTARLGENLPVALRPAGGAAGGDAAAVRRLIELELRLEASDGEAASRLLGERDEILAALAASL